MGTGPDAAIESACVTLVKCEFRGIVRARRLRRLTLSNLTQNLFLAFFYCAAGVFYPLRGWLLSQMIAAAVTSVSSVSAVGNALRLGTRQV